MPASSVTSRRVWIGAVAVVLALSVLPARYCGYGPYLHSIVMGLLSPVTAPLTALSARFEDEADPLPADQDVAELLADSREKDALIIRLQKQVRQLRRVNAELQGLRATLGDEYDFRRVRVIGRTGEGAGAAYHVSQGARDGLQMGQAVVHRASLVGRVAQIGPTSADVAPLTVPDALIEVIFTPSDIPAAQASDDRATAALLRAVDERTLEAEGVNAKIPVQVGDVARLYESGGSDAWPAAVQGMIVGRVTLVEPNPDRPLLNRVVVRTLTSLSGLTAVTVIVPRQPHAASPDETEAAP